MSAIPYTRGPTAAEVDVEQAVIALLLEGADTAWRVLDLVSQDDFLDPLHQRVFAASRRILDAGGEVTPLTLGASLGSDAGLNEIGGPDYFRRMRQKWPRNSDIAADLCQALIQNTLRRNLASLIARTESDILNSEIAADEIIADHAEAVQALTQGRARPDDPGHWYDAGKLSIETVHARSAGLLPPLLKSGICALDGIIGGMGEGDVIILAGRTGMGKSTVALAIAHAVARSGSGVFYVSLEMTADQLLQRGLSMCARERGVKIPYDLIRRGKFNDHQHDAIAQALNDDARLPFLIDQRRGLTVSQISGRARNAQAKFAHDGQKLGLIVVDHMGLIASSQNYRGNRVQELTDISHALKTMAGVFKVPLLCLCQLNRAVESREDKRPYLSDLRDAGAIEEDADTVIFTFREEYYLKHHPPKDDANLKERERYDIALANSENKLELIVTKNRNGAPATARVTCEIMYNWISE